MTIDWLTLRNFRNIESLEIKPSPKLNIIYGHNAQGKTSLLEGIFLLSTLHSFRTAKGLDLLKFGSDAMQINAQLTNGRSHKLKLRYFQNKRSLEIDDKSVRPGDFVKKIRTVIFSPESLSTIKQGPDGRRTLVDQSAFQIFDEAAESQALFERALKQRNSCLKQMRQALISPVDGRRILESLGPGYLQAAAQIVFLRLKLLDELAPRISKIASTVMGEDINIQFEYESSDTIWQERSLGSISERLKREISTSQIHAAEVALGVTLVGPHRHDLKFLFNGKDSKIYCSQGQQRALILSFKMAEIVYHDEAFGSCPILLLDDVLSEFDESKRRFLVDFLRTSRAQTFLTTTDRTQLKWPECSEFQMDAGKLKDAEQHNA